MFFQRCSKVFKSLVDCSIITVYSFDTNVAATLLQRLTKYILCGNVDDKSSQSRELLYLYIRQIRQKYVIYSIKMYFF